LPGLFSVLAQARGVIATMTSPAELDAEIARRRRAEARVVELEARLTQMEEGFRTVFEAAPSAMLVVDAAGTIVLANAQTRALFGYPPGELVGQAVEILVPERFRPRHPADRLAYFTDPRPRPMGKGRDLAGRRQDGSEFAVEIGVNPLRMGDGDFVLVSLLDITDRRRAEGQLRELNVTLEQRVDERTRAAEERAAALARSREVLRDQTLMIHSILNSMNEGVAVADPAGRLMLFNPAAERILGRGLIEGGPERWSAFYGVFELDGKTPFPAEQLPLARALRGESSGEVELLIRNSASPAGVFLSVTSSPLLGLRGESRGGIAVFRDITPRKQAESLLLASLEEKQLLLKEIHHRVKNNLQVICSLLDLQSQCTTDPASVQMFRESQTRVRSMARVHERLYDSETLANIDFAEYVEHLVENLAGTYRLDNSVRFELDLEPIGLGIDAAVPCGLLVNELVSNALKYAFPRDRANDGAGAGGGVIRIRLARLGEHVLLGVQDDGVGIPVDVDPATAMTLGLQLVCALVDQIHGRFELDRDGGTAIRITFPACSKQPAPRRKP
jgi:PAS domain S-box-containing protein